MITEDYVSFETAKLLKGKGFEEHVTHYYFTQITHVGFKDYPTGVLYTDSYPQNQNNYNNKVAAPTLQLAMKWLRNMHNIHISIIFGWLSGYNAQVDWAKESEKNTDRSDLYVWKTDLNTSYERACDEAIKYCLKNITQKEPDS